jgi:hypothetical protein
LRQKAEDLIGHPASLARAGEFEQTIMVQLRAEYMVDGTSRLPSKVIENQCASQGRFANERDSSN